MSARLSDEHLEVLHIQLSSAVRRRRGYKEADITLDVDGQCLVKVSEIARALDELRCRRASTKRTAGQYQVGPLAQMLMDMKVGDSVVVKPMARSRLTSARLTARKKLENKGGVWRSERRQSDGMMIITRMPDGISPHQPRTNPGVIELAKMSVGQTKIISFKTGTKDGYLTNGMKIRARELMNNLTANWKTERLANGKLRCKRTS